MKTATSRQREVWRVYCEFYVVLRTVMTGDLPLAISVINHKRGVCGEQVWSCAESVCPAVAGQYLMCSAISAASGVGE